MNATWLRRLGLTVALLALAFGALQGFVAWVKYRSRDHRVEGTLFLRMLFDTSVSYYYDSAPGEMAPRHEFPGRGRRVTSPARWHDLVCPDGEPSTYTPDETTFADPVWAALGFHPTEPLRFEYTYESWGEGPQAGFRATARSDLDCDGTSEVQAREGHPDPPRTGPPNSVPCWMGHLE